jgi:hypothetical protein
MWKITRYEGCFIASVEGEFHRACGDPRVIGRKDKEPCMTMDDQGEYFL